MEKKHDPDRSAGGDDLKLPRGKGPRRSGRKPDLPDEETRVRQGVIIVVVLLLVLAGSLVILAKGCNGA